MLSTVVYEVTLNTNTANCVCEFFSHTQLAVFVLIVLIEKAPVYILYKPFKV